MLISVDKQVYRAGHSYNRPPHQKCYVLELTYSGVMMRKSGKMPEYEPQPNYTFLLTPPDVRYSLEGREEGEEIWLLFELRDELLDCLAWPIGGFGIPQLEIPDSSLGRQVVQAFEDTCRYGSGHFVHGDLLARNSLDRLLLLSGRLYAEANDPLDERIRVVLQRVRDEYRQPLTIGLLANTAHLSVSRFAHLFRAEVGLSPMKYVEVVRLERARDYLLRTDLPIKEVADLTGFEDPYYFSTRFRKQFGCSPSAWRRR